MSLFLSQRLDPGSSVLPQLAGAGAQGSRGSAIVGGASAAARGSVAPRHLPSALLPPPSFAARPLRCSGTSSARRGSTLKMTWVTHRARLPEGRVRRFAPAPPAAHAYAAARGAVAVTTYQSPWRQAQSTPSKPASWSASIRESSAGGAREVPPSTPRRRLRRRAPLPSRSASARWAPGARDDRSFSAKVETRGPLGPLPLFPLPSPPPALGALKRSLRPPNPTRMPQPPEPPPPSGLFGRVNHSSRTCLTAAPGARRSATRAWPLLDAYAKHCAGGWKG